jgi:hypothetical protein
MEDVWRFKSNRNILCYNRPPSQGKPVYSTYQNAQYRLESQAWPQKHLNTPLSPWIQLYLRKSLCIDIASYISLWLTEGEHDNH